MISRKFVKESKENHIYSWDGLKEACIEALTSSGEVSKKFRLNFLKNFYKNNGVSNLRLNSPDSSSKDLNSLIQKVGEMSGSINPQAFDDSEDELLKKKLPNYANQFLKYQVSKGKIVDVGNGLWSTRGKQDINKTYFSAKGLLERYKKEILEEDAKLLTYFFAMCRRQTKEEISQGHTIFANGLGFNSPDSSFMTKIYLDIVNENKLPSPEDKSKMRSILAKHPRQIMEIMVAEGVIEEVEKGIYRLKVL